MDTLRKAKCADDCNGGVCVAPDICRCPQLYTRLIEKDGTGIKKVLFDQISNLIKFDQITCRNQSAHGMIGFGWSLGVLAVVLLFLTYFDEIRAGLGYGKCKPE